MPTVTQPLSGPSRSRLPSAWVDAPTSRPGGLPRSAAVSIEARSMPACGQRDAKRLRTALEECA